MKWKIGETIGQTQRRRRMKNFSNIANRIDQLSSRSFARRDRTHGSHLLHYCFSATLNAQRYSQVVELIAWLPRSSVGNLWRTKTFRSFDRLEAVEKYFVSTCLILVEVGCWRLNLRSFRSLDTSRAAHDWHVELYSMCSRRWPVDSDRQWLFLSVEYHGWWLLLQEMSRSSLMIDEEEETNHRLWRIHRMESLHPLVVASIPSVSPTVLEADRSVLR